MLNKKVILITGANRGIGFELVKEAAASMKEEPVEETTEEEPKGLMAR